MNKLKGRMKEMEVSVSELAEKVNLSNSTVYRKINNPCEFNIGEVKKIRSVLGLTDGDVMDIFMP